MGHYAFGHAMSFDVAEFFVWFLVFVFSVTCHEAGHAWAAWKGGDMTAYEGGQVSLDPFPHIRREPFGMLVVPVVSFLLWGWMLGWASTPYSPDWARRNPKLHALMSLAGPAANFLLALIAFGALKGMMSAGILQPPTPSTFAITNLAQVSGGNVGNTLGAVAMALSVMLILNVLLGLFNLIPLPPLDGAGLAEGIAPGTAGRFYGMLREQPMFSLIGLLIAWQAFGYVWPPAVRIVLALLYA